MKLKFLIIENKFNFQFSVDKLTFSTFLKISSTEFLKFSTSAMLLPACTGTALFI